MKKVTSVLLAVVLLLGMLAGCKQAETAGEQTPTQPAADSPVTKLETTAQRRDAAEAKMREMMSILWQVDRPITYSFKVGSGDPSVDAESYVSTLEPGKIYSGLPYTHGSGDEISFADFGERMDNGVLRMKDLELPLISGGGGSKNRNNIARIGNDCADAVFAAWAVAASSISFPGAANMTPKNGCIPVGEYKTVDSSVATFGRTKDLCVDNGEEVMFAAYALLQKADGLSVNTKGGAHAMLVSEVHVVKNGEVIDPKESYVLVHEQTSRYFDKGETRYDEALGQDVFVMGGVDRKYTFQKLFNAGYLPVTCKEFIDEAPLAAEEVTDSEAGFEMNKSRMFSGALIANYSIMAVTVEIVDKDGRVVQQQTCYNGDGNREMFLLARFEEELEQEVMSGSMVLYELESGTYTARFRTRLSTGAELVAREFTFTA